MPVSTLYRYTTLLALCTAWGAAHAQTPPAPTDSWKFSAGLGLVSRPLYPGSSDTKTSALPLLSAHYGRYFIGSVPGAGIPIGVGAYLLQDPHWRVGIGLGAPLGKSREEADAPRLRGLGDIDGTPLGSVFASYSERWWKVGGHVLTDIGGKNQGTRIAMELEARYSPLPQLMLTAGPGLTWADSKYTQTFFGVNATQSAQSGLAPYTAQSGLHTVAMHFGANYQLTPQWGLGARLSSTRLRGDAASSPLTEKRSQNTFGLFANYRF